nr:MAG TPA: hypothetical protein [Caudoviricetes sp.]
MLKSRVHPKIVEGSPRLRQPLGPFRFQLAQKRFFV